MNKMFADRERMEPVSWPGDTFLSGPFSVGELICRTTPDTVIVVFFPELQHLVSAMSMLWAPIALNHILMAPKPASLVLFGGPIVFFSGHGA